MIHGHSKKNVNTNDLATTKCVEHTIYSHMSIITFQIMVLIVWLKNLVVLFLDVLVFWLLTVMYISYNIKYYLRKIAN